MSTENICPFCGAPVDNPASTKCDSCGNALTPRVNSAATIISPRSAFNSSAEVMDEVKKLAKEGDSSAAAEVLGAEFGLNQESAKQAEDQVEYELQHSSFGSYPGDENNASPDPHPEVIDAPRFTDTPKPSSRRNWVIGGSIGATVFLCCCCCLPLLAWLSSLKTR